MKIVLAGPALTSAFRDTMRLSLIGAPLGTASTPIIPLANSLRARGHQVHVISTDPSIEETVTFHEERFKLTYCPLRGAPRYRARERSLDLFEREVRNLTDAMRGAEPDIVHAHWTYEFAEAAVRTGLPHLVTMHDLGWQYFWQFRDTYRLMRLIMKYRTMPRVRNLSVVAPFMVRKSRQYGYFGKVAVIPNGVEIPLHTKSRRPIDLARPRIVTVGNTGAIKNIGASVAAFRVIRAKLPGAELHLFGPGLDGNYARDEPGIVGHGNVDHTVLLKYLVEEATVLIHPARLETFGVIIAEAKAAGVPVVAGQRSGGVSFVCGDNGGALLVDIEDPQAIAGAALAIVDSWDSFEALSRQAMADVSRRFSSGHVADLYLQEYREVLRQLAVKAPAEPQKDDYPPADSP